MRPWCEAFRGDIRWVAPVIYGYNLWPYFDYVKEQLNVQITNLRSENVLFGFINGGHSFSFFRLICNEIEQRKKDCELEVVDIGYYHFLQRATVDGCVVCGQKGGLTGKYLSFCLGFRQDGPAPVVGLYPSQRLTHFDLLHHVRPVRPFPRRLLELIQLGQESLALFKSVCPL